MAHGSGNTGEEGDQGVTEGVQDTSDSLLTLGF